MKKTVATLLLSVVLFACAEDAKEKLAQENIHSKKAISFVVNPLGDNEVFNSQLTKSDLVARFGKENIAEKSEWYEEGTVEIVVTLLYPKSENEVTLAWKADGTLSNIILKTPNSKWNVNGLKVGMTLDEVEKLNSTGFMFYGFGWDNGGFVYNWNNGILSKNKTNIKVNLGLDWEKVGNKNIDQFTGDAVKLKSNNKKLQTLGVTVASILVKY